ncbi:MULTISPECIES: hypothetical protein [Idiomarina]|uniref:hypothetical protein n=1 Tax=Idiomarina TaxID=135575 RepID=UPI00129C01E9|nr:MULTISPECIES: hypothetical protein [Idiomarina]MRJ40787.1 hypothetical protein [Idiomarina sp. FeN1]NCU56591.1 hypothetical protein [Idiomarina sp. FenA--70]NCU58971.1 hypothetical protein [Idiomarina sp. FenBw--71]UUN14532.1 hypothetical protein KGF88_04775 [Idiomarina loihiensis]
MKLDFLTSLQQLGPCGLRPVIDTLSDSYSVMAFGDWKALAISLIDDGFVTQKGNGQYMVTPAGDEAIHKGQSFFDEADVDDEPQADSAEGDKEPPALTTATQAHRPAADHEWRRPFSPKAPYQETGKRTEEPKPKGEPAPVVQFKVEQVNGGNQVKASDGLFINLPVKNSSTELNQMTIDDLLIVFTLGKEAETIIETRLQAFEFGRKAASNE